LRGPQLPAITARIPTGADSVMNGMRQGSNPAGWLAIAATALLLQACAEKPPSGPSVRLYSADVTGAAKSCEVPKVAPVAGQETPVAVKVGNDGGWCGITVNAGGKPYAAGLLATAPAHGKVLIHTVGNDTRIDYTPVRGFTGSDVFSVKLIPGDAIVRAAVSVVPS
jgi:hypothetical protein